MLVLKRALIGAISLCTIPFSSFAATGSKSIPIEVVRQAFDRAGTGRDVVAGIVESRTTAADAGVWSVSGGQAIWTLDISMTGARTLAIHADRVQLPVGSLVTLTSADGSISHAYVDADFANGKLWSAPVLGDAAQLVISLPNADKNAAVFEIDSFDVGLPAKSTATASASKSMAKAAVAAGDGRINYSCVANADRDYTSRATVDINLRKTGAVLLLSGTLVANTSGDGTPFILSAWHGEDNPAYPTPTTERKFYWGAKTACGSTASENLDIAGPVYAVATSTGASVVSHYSDTVLYKLDAPVPAAANAYYLGWDVTVPTAPTTNAGAPVSGQTQIAPAGSKALTGVEFYSVHHMSNGPQQFAADNDGLICLVQFADIIAGYSGDVGATGYVTMYDAAAGGGQIGTGTSGGNLVDASHRMLGTTYGSSNISCTGTARDNELASTSLGGLFASLSSAWNGGGTPATSLKSWLDPTGSGVLTFDGMEGPVTPPTPPTLTLNISASSITVGSSVTLSWNSDATTSCTASGSWSCCRALKTDHLCSLKIDQGRKPGA